MKIDDVLALIQDVDWVVGSFLANRDGELLVYQMPPEFGEEELGRTTARLASIVRSAEICGVKVEQCDLSLSRYQLVMKRCSAGMLCVMVEAPVSRRALSMAMRIALAELPTVVAALEDPDGEESTSIYQLPSEKTEAHRAIGASARASSVRSAELRRARPE